MKRERAITHRLTKPFRPQTNGMVERFNRRLGEHLGRMPQNRAAAESARGVSPRAAHRSGLDTLASSGSCHRTKAAASRRELELLLLPVGSLPTSVTCPLRSTGITPLPRYYGAVRPCPPHRYFRPRSFAACTFSLGIAGQVLKFRTRARTRGMPPIHRAPRGQ